MQSALIEKLFFVIVGLLLGILTGLFPGIHLNTVSSLILFLRFQGSLEIVLLIVAMNVMHSCMDFVPTILIGAPSETSFVSALPGHRLFLKGKALLGIQLAVIGNVFGIVGGIVLIPVYWLFAEQTKLFLVRAIPWVLASALLLQINSEKRIRKKMIALVIVVLAGALGSIGLKEGENQLFALVTGFFGTSTLLFSLRNQENGIMQEKGPFQVKPKKWFWSGALGAVTGSLVSLFPAISSSHAAFVAQGIKQRFSSKQFLVLIGAINASATVFSFVALQALGKARTGSAVAIQELYPLSSNELGLVLATMLFSIGIAAVTTIWVARKSIGLLQRIPYERLNFAVIILLIGLTFLLSKSRGFLVMTIATGIGLIALLQGVKKSHCMAFLLVPTILFYWSF